MLEWNINFMNYLFLSICTTVHTKTAIPWAAKLQIQQLVRIIYIKDPLCNVYHYHNTEAYLTLKSAEIGAGDGSRFDGLVS